MRIHETVSHCPDCAEVTPHSRRVVALPRCFAVLLLIAAGLCFVKTSGGWALGGVLTFAALGLWLQDRERFWNIACVRCRARRLEQVRRLKPKLGSTTIIDVW